MSLTWKLARGNVRRSMRSYSVYFATLAFGSCLLYSFSSATDYLQTLDLSPEMASVMVDLNKYLPPFGFFIALVFVFIVSYASRMLVRRRKRELAFYRLMGMSGWRVGRVLFCECLIVGAASLAAGIGVGVVLSPAFGAVTAYAFATPWRFSLVVSPVGCAITVFSFVTITLFSSLASQRELHRHGIAELMRADREVETIGREGEGASPRSLRFGLGLLGIVYLCCGVQPLQMLFILFLIPMCAMACLGTYLVLRYLASHLPARLRRIRSFYLHGLNCFVMRQVESKIRATCGALTWVSALMAVGVCMVAMGIGFRLAFDVAPVSPSGLDALSYAPVSFVGIYYGMTFVVAACAILALHQLSEAQDNAPRYVCLRRLGCSEGLLARSVLGQVSTYFVVPGAMALVHDAFGLVITGCLLAGFTGLSNDLIVRDLLVTLVVVGAAFLGYLLVTFASCRREACA